MEPPLTSMLDCRMILTQSHRCTWDDTAAIEFIGAMSVSVAGPGRQSYHQPNNRWISLHRKRYLVPASHALSLSQDVRPFVTFSHAITSTPSTVYNSDLPKTPVSGVGHCKTCRGDAVGCRGWAVQSRNAELESSTGHPRL